MVKESERKRPYRPRAPHKDGCQCSVCRQAVAQPAPEKPKPVGGKKPQDDLKAKVFKLLYAGERFATSPKIRAMVPDKKAYQVIFQRWIKIFSHQRFLENQLENDIRDGKVESIGETEPPAIPEAATVSGEVALSTLAVGQEFKSNGILYKVGEDRRSVLIEIQAGRKIPKYAINIPGDTVVKTT